MNALLDQLTQSEVAHLLSLVLAHSLWQGTVVAVVLAFLLGQMRNSTARARYLVSCVAMLAFLAWPLVTFWQVNEERHDVIRVPWSQTAGPSDAEQRIPAPGNSDSSRIAPSISSTEPRTKPTPKTEVSLHWQSWTILFWLTGMVLISLWHLMGWIGLQRLRHQATTTLTGELAATATRLARQMKLPSSIRVCWSSRITGAISFGWLRPIVLLPASMATGFSTREIEMILAHEFAHLRRRDYLVNLLQSAVETLMFYHPGVWWIGRQMRREREHACDDVAVRVTGDARTYAHALVRLAVSAAMFSEDTPRLAMAAGGRSGLRHRIERLVRPANASSTALALRPVSGAIVLTLMLLFMGAPDTTPSLQAQENVAYGPRGSIRDRNGVLLAVSDRPDRQIVFNLEKVVDAWRAKPGREVPLVTYSKSKADGTIGDVQEPDIVYLFQQLVSPSLEKLKLGREFDAEAIRTHYRAHRGGSPFAYARELSEEQHKVAASLKASVPGMDIRTVMLRRYPYKALAAHTMGIVTHSSGVEGSMQAFLGPPPGDDDTAKSAARGADVYLTLDVRHQYIAERALRDSNPAIGRGAVVLLDVHSGDVLAMASAPSFDPNDFIPSISREKLKKYSKATTIPLVNRAVRSFVPGATFLVATSLAGICDGQEGFQHTCTGGSTFGNRYMQCWIAQKDGMHGPMDLRKGMENSCNPYFYNLGNAIRPEKFDSIATLLGIGQDVGIELPENDRGIFPNRTWWEKQRPREPYTAATVANMSIGQGAVQASPLQLASLMVPVANGGLVWHPRLVDRVVANGDVSREEKRPRKLAGNLRDQGLTDTGLEALRSAMRAAVSEGYALGAKVPELPIAGRTGTAQNWRLANGLAVKDNHTLFIAYAPMEQPKWAICVLVQGGKSGGTSAAPIAAHILTQVAELEAGKRKVEVQPVQPIEGSFDPVDRVSFPKVSK